MDLIIANPPNPLRNHTTLVIGHTATYDTADDWPFDEVRQVVPQPPLITESPVPA